MMRRNEIEIDFVLLGKNHRKFLKDVIAIPRKLQHWLMVTDIEKCNKVKQSSEEQTNSLKKDLEDE